jgi:two-component system, OmpR family, sensor histidine kinase QseC
VRSLSRWWAAASLQWRLTLGLLAATSLVWSVVLVLTWLETEHELSELLDAHLAQTAAVLATQTGDQDDDDFTTAPVLHKYQPRVAFQIWHDRQLVARSALAPEQPLTGLDTPGVSDQKIDGKSWRVFAAQGHEPHVWVLVAELQSARQDILKAGLFSAVGPVLLALPVLALLIWAGVFRALAPLRHLGQSVAQRDPNALHPLSPQAVVAEARPLVLALNRLFEKVTQHIDGERHFTADAAHELRTPIAAIRMQAQVALGAAQAADRQAALDAVLQGCDRATRLVSQLLQLARLDTEPDGGASVPCDAVAETRQTLAALAPQALARQQSLSLQAPDSLALSMPAGLVGVLVGNLVDNAQRYSPSGARIEVVWMADSSIRLVVQDSGPGLDDHDLIRLGDRFFRVPGTGADGSGLGWSIVQRLAQRYQIGVAVDRSPELGGLRVTLSWS